MGEWIDGTGENNVGCAEFGCFGWFSLEVLLWAAVCLFCEVCSVCLQVGLSPPHSSGVVVMVDDATVPQATV